MEKIQNQNNLPEWIDTIISLEKKKEDLTEAAPPLKAEAAPVIHGQQEDT